MYTYNYNNKEYISGPAELECIKSKFHMFPL